MIKAWDHHVDTPD